MINSLYNFGVELSSFANLGDVDSKTSVDSGALNAHEYSKVDAGPARSSDVIAKR